MESVVRAIRWVVEALLRPLDGLAPWASLAILALPTAAVILVVVRWTSPQRIVSRSRARMAAAILEMRLYLDHPGQLLLAQARLAGWSVVYVGCLLPSLLVMAGPLGLLYLHLEIRHGYGPCASPSTTIVRIEASSAVALRDLAIDAPAPLAVTGRVHAEDEHALYARVAIEAPGRHEFSVLAGDRRQAVAIEADPDAAVVSPARSAGLAQLWALGAEPPLDAGAIRSITIQYPERSATLPWWLYWLGLATVFAMLLRRPFRVAL